MSEEAEVPKIVEIGRNEVARLITVLQNREEGDPKDPQHKGFNLVGWGGTATELKVKVEAGKLYPASAFAVVADGIVKYKRAEEQMRDDTDSMRELSGVLSEGSEIYGKAKEIDEATLKGQIREYIESHGGVFDANIDWQAFIKERADRIKKRADNLDEVNR